MEFALFLWRYHLKIITAANRRLNSERKKPRPVKRNIPKGDDDMKVLKIHTLEKGWCDKDYLLLHTAFQILVDFVENEKPDQWAEEDQGNLHRLIEVRPFLWT